MHVMMCRPRVIFWKFKALFQAFFFGHFSANSTQLKLPVLEFFWNFGLSFFPNFAWVLSFFHEFLGLFFRDLKNVDKFLKNVHYFAFLKIFYSKNDVFGGTLSFPPKKWSFHSLQRQLNSTGVAGFWVFSRFCLSFFRILLEFWVFWGLSFFRNVQKKSLYICITYIA